MNCIFRVRALATFLFVGIVASSACGQEPTPASPTPPTPVFTRLVHTSKTAIALETRAVKLLPIHGSGATVWLVGTAHIGEAEYYKQIQKLLDQQSLVLFEGVRQGKPDTPVAVDPKGGANTSQKPTSAFPAKDKSTYRLFADAVGLDFQLYDIDYSKKNFRNSDLTWAEVTSLSAAQGKETQNTVKGLGRLLDADSAEGQALSGFLKTIKADPGSQEALRMVLAEALSKPGVVVSFLGEATGDVIIKKRNEHVAHDLVGEIRRPTVAIFYGAAHMPDLEARIIGELHYREAGEKWFAAITADESKVTGNGKLLLSSFRQMLGTMKSH